MDLRLISLNVTLHGLLLIPSKTASSTSSPSRRSKSGLPLLQLPKSTQESLTAPVHHETDGANLCSSNSIRSLAVGRVRALRGWNFLTRSQSQFNMVRTPKQEASR